MNEGPRWSPGTSYGPVLTQTDLYLLNPKLELHPIMTQTLTNFHLVFNLGTGQTGGFNADNRDRDLPFELKDDSATLPRVTELYIITKHTPWCTHVKNDHGVSMADICKALWTDYSENYITEPEFISLPPTQQERVKRAATNREHPATGPWGHYQGVSGVPFNRCKRLDWLRDRVFFDGLDRDDDYAKKRLGFAAPNIFVLGLTS